MKHYTVDTSGNNVQIAHEKGYHSYYANNVTAIEIQAKNKKQAKTIISKFCNVLYVFE